MNSNRNRNIALIIAATLLVAYTAVLAWRVAKWREFGWAGLAFQPYIAEKDEKAMQRAVGWFKFRSETVILVAADGPAAKGGVKPGDRVVAIAGVPTKESEKIAAKTGHLKAGDSLHYRFERGGRAFERTLTLESPLQIPQTLWSVAVSIAVGFIFFVISTSVFFARRNDRGAFLFFLLCSVGASFFLSTAAAEVESHSFRGVTPAQLVNVGSIIIFAIYFVLTVLLASFLLHFALVFPHERPLVKRHPRLITYVHLTPFAIFGLMFLGIFSMTGSQPWRVLALALPALLLVGAALWRLRMVAATAGRKAALLDHPWLTVAAAAGALVLVIQPLRLIEERGFVVGIIFSIVWVVVICSMFGAYALISCISLYRTYRESGTEQKRQLRWPLWGLIVAVAGAGFVAIGYNIIAAVYMDLILETPWIAVATQSLVKLFYLLIPISFAFGILKYKLMEIDVVIKKTLVYTVVSGIVVGIYLLLVAGFGTLLVRYSGIESQSVTIVSTLAIAALFIPLRNVVQRVVDRRFARRRSDSAEMLRRIGQQFALATNPDALLQQAAELIQQALQLRSVAILVPARAGTQVAAKVGLPDAISTRTLRFEPAAAPRGGEAVMVADGNYSPEQREALGSVRAEAVAAARGEGENVAVICAGAPLSDETLNENDLHVLAAAADRLGAALDTIRYKEEEAEFRQAQTIQQTLLPSTLPTVGGMELSAVWKPARTVGGDYYDAIPFGERSMALCIGDVVGKGMPAALLMSSLQATVRAVATADAEPDAVCARVRRVVTANLTGGRFITFFYGRVDADARRFTYCNAGHNPPLLVRTSGEIHRLERGGPILGRLFSNSAFQGDSIALEAGDRLVMYTDGVTEATNDADEPFGEARLESVVAASRATSAAELQNDILSALDAFAGGKVADDVALVVLTVDRF